MKGFHRVTIHCSASPNGKEISIQEMEEWHRERGFRGIGYHFVIEPNGKTYEGRPLPEQGAHVQGANEGNVGICLVGTDRFTRAQFQALKVLLDRFIMEEKEGPIDPWRIYGHCEFPSAQTQKKTCPNLRIADLYAWYLGNYEGAIEKYFYGN